jgi:hypothetical protein
MLDMAKVDQASILFELFDNVLVSILDILAFKVRYWIYKFPNWIYGTYNFPGTLHNNSGCKTDPVIIFTKIGSLEAND